MPMWNLICKTEIQIPVIPNYLSNECILINIYKGKINYFVDFRYIMNNEKYNLWIEKQSQCNQKEFYIFENKFVRKKKRKGK